MTHSQALFLDIITWQHVLKNLDSLSTLLPLQNESGDRLNIGEESWERIVLLEPGTGLLGVAWLKGKIISRNNS